MAGLSFGNNMDRIVVISGAGISAESGLQTFRGPSGLWRGHRPEEVACPQAWQRDPGLVLAFYNERRRAVRAASPIVAHRTLVDLERCYNVHIVTQNVDDLHERAGSSNILHLHGEIRKARSTCDSTMVIHLGNKDLYVGDVCPLGGQLRPHIVWFGERVTAMDQAERIVGEADVLIVVGTSLMVHPANWLIHAASPQARRILINPEIPESITGQGFEVVAEMATVGVPGVVADLLAKASR